MGMSAEYYLNTYNPTQSLHLTSTISHLPPNTQISKTTSCITQTEKTMITPKRLIAMAKKWQKKAAITRRRRISYPTTTAGYFVVYTTDQKRFVVPLEYLKNNIFIELFRMSEEEFGLPGNGPITLPFDGVFMEYVISFLTGRRSVSKTIEKALLIGLLGGTAIDNRCSLKSFALSHQQQSNHQLFLQGC